MPEITPQQIVAELNKHIIGQSDAKRAVKVSNSPRIFSDSAGGGSPGWKPSLIQSGRHSTAPTPFRWMAQRSNTDLRA